MKLNKVAVLTAVAVSVTGAAFAAPQTTFEKGQTQIDAGIFTPQAESGDYKNDTKTNFAGGVTHALSDKLAVQYNYTGLGTDRDTNGTPGTSGHMHEGNLVYSLGKNVAVYGGYAQIKADADGTNVGFKNNIAQAGIIAKAPLGDKVELYGKAGVGTKRTTTWEAGAAFKASDDLDINVGYKYLNTAAADKGEYGLTDDANVSFKGLTAGLSYRFGGSAKKVEAPAPVMPVYTPAPQPVVVAPAPQPVHVNNDYYVNSIHFGFDQSTPLANQQANLDLLVNAAKANPNNTFKLVGNTDSRGSYEYNQALSEARVNNVLNYVVSQGLPASQFKTMYKGYSNPAASNDTDQGRADNRRVDVYINK